MKYGSLESLTMSFIPGNWWKCWKHILTPLKEKVSLGEQLKITIKRNIVWMRVFVCHNSPVQGGILIHLLKCITDTEFNVVKFQP